MHDRRIEHVRRDLSLAVDAHVAGHAQPVDIGLERAQLVRQRFGQHRDHAAREVHRSPALARIGVERVAVANVMRDIGDRHDQAPALAPAGDRLAVHGIVEVACVLAVDRDQRHIAKVDAVPAVHRPNAIGQRRGLGQRLGRELVRHLVLAHRDLDLHAGVVDLSQHLGDAAHRLRVQRRRLGQLDRHHLPDRRAGGGVLRDQDVLAVAAVLGGDDPLPALVQQAADDRRLAALEDVEHPAFGPALAVVALDAHAHAVAVQHAAHLLRRQVDGGLALVGKHETVAVAMALDAAVQFARQGGAGSRRA